jgi:hypothetical protein
VHLAKGYPSLFVYATKGLGLRANLTYTLITIARKAREVPALREQLEAGRMTLSNARRVASVLTVANQAEWIAKAAALSVRELEREITRVRPQAEPVEHASYISGDRIRLELGLSEHEMLRLRRAQDLVSRSLGQSASLEDTMKQLLSEYLDKHDPVERAKRFRVRGGGAKGSKAESGEKVELVTPRVGDSVQGEAEPTRRAPTPAAVEHAVHWRDRDRCTETLPDGSRCGQSRWTELHHVKPVHLGGKNTVDNLVTLCSAHHRMRHEKLRARAREEEPDPVADILT